MLKTFSLWLEDRDAIYYVAWTPHQEHGPIIAISNTGHDEIGRLIKAARVPLNVQFHFEEPMSYQQIQQFLDERAAYETKVLSKFRQKYIFLHGQGVNPNKFNTL